VVADCAALKGELLESELFGHERGAFTGAHAARRGLAEVADRGTLFVDEIGEMPPELQSKLLRVLERGEYRPLGSSRYRRSDIRILAATNRDLAREVREERFRADLYYRLNVLSITIPPLRLRREDIPILAQHFVGHSRVTATGRKRLHAGAIERLCAYSWPGNVRELANVIERAVIVSGDAEIITEQHLPPDMSGAESPAPVLAGMSLEHVERQAVEAALRTTAGNRTKAAQMLGITRGTLREKLRKYGITDGA
jgi:two-component system response regulator HydG